MSLCLTPHLVELGGWGIVDLASVILRLQTQVIGSVLALHYAIFPEIPRDLSFTAQ